MASVILSKLIRCSLLPLALVKTLAMHLCLVLGSRTLSGIDDDFAPHEAAGFEGYYSRTLLEDGGTLAIIFCWVKHAKRRPNLVCISYSPREGQEAAGFTHEFYPEHLTLSTLRSTPDEATPFSVTAQGLGIMSVGAQSVEYCIHDPEAKLSLKLIFTNCTPWSVSHPLLGPMGPLAPLSPYLPLNWHVQTIASSTTANFTHEGHTYNLAGKTHFEKNWGTSFPGGWIWCQAFGPDEKCLSFAGGEALPGVQAFLIGYRSAKYQWDFRPPFAAGLSICSPFMHVRHDSRAGSVELDIGTLFQRLRIVVQASPDTFVGLPAPLQDGHEPRFAFESFRATVWAELFTRRRPWHGWTRVEAGYLGVSAEGAPCGALEFGGKYCHQTKVD
ncbi:hypothetical protein DAEQUDRAFT_691750 [Daedalea quercina L-15889]|uniref:Tocopherol cyclase n=1 Tax=Daedalea quercina L-15889 TaxID=1314783 RepID=A0A165Q230_9APHY|nr:hypothetical protein DAEQUDRAFT_691750 [Daedalea quercina L-15889]